jgi:hypothetical protein
MAFTFTEALADLAPVVALADQVQALIEAVPPKDQAKPSDYIKCAAAVLTAAASLADTVEAQVKS